MSELGLVQRFWIAVHDVRGALSYIFRPWNDLRAVKTTQVDIVNLVSGCQADIADALVLLNKFSQQVARLEARAGEHDTVIRELLQRADPAHEPTRDSSQDVA